LSSAAGVPTPRICLIDHPTPNAFATGRNPAHAALAVTTGLLALLNREELAGVLGHELSHVLHRDTLISSVAATVAGAIGYLGFAARFGALFGGYGGRGRRGGSALFILLMTTFASFAAMLIQLAISRSREFIADEGGARLTGNPMGLAHSLEKIARGAARVPLDASPATAHLFIVSPLLRGGLSRLFSTHPPVEERVARLMEMAGASQAN
ncbi:MAG: M48 family metalloprotease, partial [Vicinamibacteria bacterium]